MAEGGIELEEFDTPYDDVNNLQDLQGILDDSQYQTVEPNADTTLENLKRSMLNENLSTLKSLVTIEHSNFDEHRFELESVDLRQRLMRKGKELYLRTKGVDVKQVKFGEHKYKAIQITQNGGKNLTLPARLERDGMKKEDPYYQMLTDNQETSFTDSTVEQRDREIEELAELRRQAENIFGELGNTRFDPSRVEQGGPSTSVIEEIPRQLEQSKELGNVLTDEDRQTIVKYLDFVKQNYNKKIQLLNDIEFNKKAIEDAEKKLATEPDKDKQAELIKKITDSEANIQASKQMLDQILAYNERQFEDINMRLKSKFTLREKIGNIFRKYGLTITAITLALGLVIDTIVSAVRGGGASGGVTPTGGGSGITDKIKQSLKNFSTWLLEMAKKAVDNLPAIIGSIVSFLLKAAASVVGFLAEHLILFVIALAFALYEALKVGYQDIKRRKK